MGNPHVTRKDSLDTWARQIWFSGLGGPSAPAGPTSSLRVIRPKSSIRPAGKVKRDRLALVVLLSGESGRKEHVLYRRVRRSDILAMAEIRAGDWGTEKYWRERIRQYLSYKQHPGGALRPRVSFVCVERDRIIGLIAGHLTRRFGCDGELEWVSVRPECRGRGVASGLFCRLAKWFVAHQAKRICVDVEPSNQAARQFYRRHGAENLEPHWMVWNDIRSSLRGSMADSCC